MSVSGTAKFISSRNIHEVIEACKHNEVVGIDTETTALHPKDGKLRLIQLAVPGVTYILDAFRTDPLLLLHLFDGNTRLVGHNLAFDLLFLDSVGLTLPHGKQIFDTQIATQLLDAGIITKGHKLADIVPEYLGFELDKSEQRSDWSLPILTQEQLRYAARDSAVLIPLYHVLMKKLEEAFLTRTMKLEMRALPGIMWLNKSGVHMNRDKWNTLADKNREKVENLEYALADITDSHDVMGFSLYNWRSPDQVTKLFNRRFEEQGKTVREKIELPCSESRCNFYNISCDYHSVTETIKVPYAIPNSNSETLMSLAVDGDELAQNLLKYREHVKSRDTYGRAWADQWIQPDGYVYPSYLQLGAARTGRMACIDPAYQTIPHAKEFRECTEAEEGHIFVDSDYSQIELRICVEMSHDEAGLRAYCVDNSDLHRATAALILGVDLTDKTPEGLERAKKARQVAKSLNFGLIFGSGAETMRKYALKAFGVVLSEKEAIKLRNAWRNTYEGIVAWQKKQGADHIRETRTLGGRRRIHVDKFTEKLNSPVQGTGIDGLKAAIALCYERRNMVHSSVKPATYCHDELLFQVAQGHEDEVELWVKKNMEDGMGHFLKTVPVVAEPQSIPNWGGK